MQARLFWVRPLSISFLDGDRSAHALWRTVYLYACGDDAGRAAIPGGPGGRMRGYGEAVPGKRYGGGFCVEKSFGIAAAAVLAVFLLQYAGRLLKLSELEAKDFVRQPDYLSWQSQMKITGVVSLDEFMESGSEVPVEQGTQHRFDGPEEVIERKN